MIQISYRDPRPIYEQVEQEGCICSVPGKGSFVADARDTAALRRNELLVQLKEISEELKKLGVDEETMTEWIKGGMEHD